MQLLSKSSWFFIGILLLSGCGKHSGSPSSAIPGPALNSTSLSAVGTGEGYQGDPGQSTATMTILACVPTESADPFTLYFRSDLSSGEKSVMITLVNGGTPQAVPYFAVSGNARDGGAMEYTTPKKAFDFVLTQDPKSGSWSGQVTATINEQSDAHQMSCTPR